MDCSFGPSVVCPGDCSFRGVCGTDGTCDCQPGFGSSDCSVQTCPSDCSSHGVCMSTGTCACEPGYEGVDCATKAKARDCETGCSGHGQCDHSGKCACDSGFRVDSVPIVAAIPLVSTDRAETERVSVTRARVPRIKENDAKSRRVTRTATVTEHVRTTVFRMQHVIVTRDFPESPAPVPARTVWSARATDFVTKVSATVIIFGVERPVTFRFAHRVRTVR